MSNNTHIPRPVLVIGLLGVLPFAILSMLSITGAFLPRSLASSALVLYGAVILSFLGGANWGLAITQPHPGIPGRLGDMTRRLAISVLPALAAVGLWFLTEVFALLGLAVAFVALLAYEMLLARVGAVPIWYPALRIRLTVAVVVCLLTAALIT